MLRALRQIDGVADARIEQPADYPEFRFAVDRTRIQQLGLNENDVTDDVATSIAARRKPHRFIGSTRKTGSLIRSSRKCPNTVSTV